MPRTRWEAIVAGDIRLPVNDTLGFRIEASPDPAEQVVMTWRVPAELCNAAGNLQGGVLAAFADALLGAASSAHLPEDGFPALAEMKISIFRPAPVDSVLRGVGRVVKAGGRILFAESEVTGEDGRLIARASGTEVPAS